MTTTLRKALALVLSLTMLVLAVPGLASAAATGPEANAARETVNIRFSQYANSVDDQEGMANDPIKKAIEDILEREEKDDEEAVKDEIKIVKASYNLLLERDRKRYIADLTRQMTELAKNLEFEKAALIRDEIQRIKDRKDLED